jgi:bifunctional DNase/RNase
MRPEYVIVLTENGGDGQMWIGVGRAEATALALSLASTELPRPMTYQFTAALLAGAGGALREVRITSLTSEVFYARAILENSAAIDARPSDALNLAAISGAPVLAAASLLPSAGSPQLPADLKPYQPEPPPWVSTGDGAGRRRRVIGWNSATTAACSGDKPWTRPRK